MAEEGLKKREAEVRDLIDYDQKVAATSAYNPEGGAGAKPMDELMTNKIFYTLLKNAGDFATVAGPDEAIKKAEALATMPECEDVADPSAVRNDATWVDWYVKEKKGKDPNADGDKERDAEVAARGNELKVGGEVCWQDLEWFVGKSWHVSEVFLGVARENESTRSGVQNWNEYRTRCVIVVRKRTICSSSESENANRRDGCCQDLRSNSC